jgi:hypothetical protein
MAFAAVVLGVGEFDVLWQAQFEIAQLVECACERLVARGLSATLGTRSMGKTALTLNHMGLRHNTVARVVSRYEVPITDCVIGT